MVASGVDRVGAHVDAPHARMESDVAVQGERHERRGPAAAVGRLRLRQPPLPADPQRRPGRPRLEPGERGTPLTRRVPRVADRPGMVVLVAGVAAVLEDLEARITLYAG